MVVFSVETAYLLHGCVSVLHGVVQGCGGQQFLVAGHRGDDFYSLHRVDNIRETLASAFCPGMGADGEYNGAVQQCGV